MKKIILFSLSCLFSLAMTAQEAAKKIDFKAPTPSPEASFTQQFGGSEIGVAYARPLARGRKVFGALVPYDSLWRTGASDCTTLKFKEEVIVGDKKMSAGKYALFTIPKADEWTIIINSDTTLHGAFGYDDKKDLHRFVVKSMKTDRFYEVFTIEINDFTPQGDASLNLMWENTMVKIPLKNVQDEAIMAEIQKRVVEGRAQSADVLFQSATYYYTTQRDLVQAGQWATAAANADPENFYIPNLAQKIFADLKDYRAAIDMAKRAIPLGEKKKMTTTVANLNKRIAEWQGILGEKPTQTVVTTPKSDASLGHDMSKMASNTEGSKKVETKADAGHDMSKMKKNTEGVQNSTAEVQNPKSTEGVKTADLRSQFAPVLAAYYALKDALVADNAKLAAEKGKAMKTALGSIDTKSWTAKQRVAYDEVAKKMDTDAEHIGDNAGKIDHQREHFMTLSNNLTTLVKSLKINAETTYSQFCPMANDGKGAFWLSKEDKVKNPYYGKKMLTCGSVKETLK